MQPYSLSFAILLFFTFKKRFSLTQIFILAVFIASTFILIANPLNFIAFRSYFNYFSLFFVSYVSFYVLKSKKINFELFLKMSIGVWVFIGIVQTIFYREFLTFLVSSSRTTESRGVTSLAAEPTFYGIVLIFFLIYLLHTKFHMRNFYIFLCVFGIIFLAKSSMAVLFLFIIISFYAITHISFKYLFISAISFALVPMLIEKFMSGTRLAKLISKIADDPVSSVLGDASVNDRVFHVFFSLKGSYDNYFLPNGYLSWNGYALNEVPKYGEYVMVDLFSIGGRIMSGYGAAFFELGFITIFVPIALFFLYFSIYKNDIKKLLFFFLTINAIMFSAIPIGFSLFSFYIGFLGFLSWQKRRDTEDHVDY
jgi:hypothetical protein